MRTIPEVGKAKPTRLPSVADRTLANGLRVIAARRPGVPRFEARLLVPTARTGRATDAAKARVLARTLLSGTERRTALDIAEELQRIGGSLDATVDAEDLVVYGSALSTALEPFLALMAEVLTGAAYPADEVALERERAAQELALARSQPETVAREALLGRLFPDHPYGRPLPSDDDVRSVTRAQLRSLHGARLGAAGSLLVLVGDLRPERAIDRAEAALGGWESGESRVGLRSALVAEPAPILLVDRPGAVQTNIRIGGHGLPRGLDGYPALAVANLVFGGYFVSRLVDNIREKRGFTYSPGSAVQQQRAASYLWVQADVGTEVTAPALAEIRYELERMCAGPIEPDELRSAKRYLAGTLAMSIQTQSGLASYLATLAVAGLPVEYLRDFPKAAEQVSADDVIDAGRRFFAPRRLLTTLVGDASAIERAVEPFGDVEVRRA